MLKIILAVLFLAIGVSMVRGFLNRRRFVRLTGKVIAIDESVMNRYKAVIDVPDHAPLAAPYEDAGTYKVGQKVHCMWDGKDEVSLSVDFRKDLLIGGMLGIAMGIGILLHHVLVGE